MTGWCAGADAYRRRIDPRWLPVVLDDRSSRPMRASDLDRNAAITQLSEHYAQGRLDLAEFEARMSAAQEATFVQELDPLFADLPADHRAAVPGVGRLPRRVPRPPFAVLVVVALVATIVLSHGLVLVALLATWWLVGGAARRHRWRRQAPTGWSPPGRWSPPGSWSPPGRW